MVKEATLGHCPAATHPDARSESPPSSQKGLVDAAAGGGLEHDNLLPDSRCLNVA